MFSPCVQSTREKAVPRNGWPRVSTEVSACCIVSGNSASSITRIAPRVDDLGHLLDRHRASLDAGTARRALPHGFDRQGRRGADKGLGEIAARVVREALQVENDVARREHLADPIGRADGRAAAALGAGVEIEQVFPGEAGQGVDAQLFGFFEIDLSQGCADRRQPGRVDVQSRRDDVRPSWCREPRR